MALKERFNRAANTYNQSAKIQRISADHVFALASVLSPSLIMDVGCGTGVLTKKLAMHFPSATIEAIDISENMIQPLQSKKYKNIHAVCSDYLTIKYPKAFHLIASNAALHWMDTNLALQKISGELHPTGKAILAIFGSNTSQELQTTLPLIGRKNNTVSKTFHNKKEMVDMGARHFKYWDVETKEITLKFTSIRQLLNVQRQTGVNATVNQDGLWTLRQLNELEKIFIEKYKSVQLTYEIHYCRGQNS